MVEPQKAKKARSPRYPGIGLELAVDKARVLWDQVGKTSIAADGAIELLGYSARSGPGTVTLSALSKYGLIEDVEGTGRGKREIKLTPLAQTILLEDSGSDGYRAAIAEAARSPVIFGDLWEKYGPDLPSSDTPMKIWLVRDKGFIENVAQDLIHRFRNTVTWAGLDDADTFTGNEAESEDGSAGSVAQDGRSRRDESRRRKQDRKGQDGMLSIPVAIAGGDPIYVEGKFPITEQDWGQFMAVLTAMKPGLVADEQTSGDSDAESVADQLKDSLEYGEDR
jgi:hypothetical protein